MSVAAGVVDAAGPGGRHAAALHGCLEDAIHDLTVS
jgi:hypothetical protein